MKLHRFSQKKYEQHIRCNEMIIRVEINKRFCRLSTHVLYSFFEFIKKMKESTQKKLFILMKVFTSLQIRKLNVMLKCK